jgi:hypothetical protein
MKAYVAYKNIVKRELDFSCCPGITYIGRFFAVPVDVVM